MDEAVKLINKNFGSYIGWASDKDVATAMMEHEFQSAKGRLPARNELARDGDQLYRIAGDGMTLSAVMMNVGYAVFSKED